METLKNISGIIGVATGCITDYLLWQPELCTWRDGGGSLNITNYGATVVAGSIGVSLAVGVILYAIGSRYE